MDDNDDLIRRLGALGTHQVDSAQQSADLTAMAQARPQGRVLPKLRLAGAFLAGLMIGGTGLAAADALPDSAQHVAYTALSKVGVDVPNPERYWGDDCEGDPVKNHGAYVSQATGEDKAVRAKSNCGKPDKAKGADDVEGTDGTKPAKANKPAKAAKGPCHGKPDWAGNKSMTPEERAAAAAERAAECGPDDDDEIGEAGTPGNGNANANGNGKANGHSKVTTEDDDDEPEDNDLD